MMDDIVRKVLIENNSNLEETCLGLTLLNIALANSATLAWYSKYYYKAWRPHQAIHYQDNNTSWEDLGASRANAVQYNESNFIPAFPDYVSGHAAFGCATMQILANMYQSYDVDFTYTSAEWNNKTVDAHNRTRRCIVRQYTSNGNYPGLVKAMAEMSASRVFNGVHYRFSGSNGCKAGMDIANLVYQKQLLRSKDQTARSTVTTNAVPGALDDIMMNTPTTGYMPVFCDRIPLYPYE